MPFHDLAARTGLPLSRVYRLARHLVRWRRARVCGAVHAQAVYAANPHAAPDVSANATLGAFAAASTLSKAIDRLCSSQAAVCSREQAVEQVLRCLRKGQLRESQRRRLNPQIEE